MYDYAYACYYYARLCNDLVHVRIIIHVLYPTLGRTNFFLFISGSYLEVPGAVLFHATATHCH